MNVGKIQSNIKIQRFKLTDPASLKIIILNGKNIK